MCVWVGVGSLCSFATMASSKIRRSGPSSEDMPRIGEIRVWLQRLSVQGKIKVMDPALVEELKSTVESGNHLDCFEMVDYDLMVASSSAAPMASPTAATPNTRAEDASAQIPLPPGISSVFDWGRTVCDLPKVKSRGMRYREMAISDIKEVSEYLTWILQQSPKKSPKINDLANYLKKTKWGHTGDTLKIPGSNEPRILKD